MRRVASGPEEHVKFPFLTAVFLFAEGICTAGYHELVAGPGGTIYFRLNSTPISSSAYSVAPAGDRLQLVRLDTPVDDVSASGHITIGAFVMRETCYGGSDCLRLPACEGSFLLSYASLFSFGNESVATVSPKLSRTGFAAWIHQDGCGIGSLGHPLPSGLYSTFTLDLRVPEDHAGTKLASTRTGRLVIAESPAAGAARVLTLDGTRLRWFDESGGAPVFTVAPVAEAVTDASGATIAYVEPDTAQLHLISNGFDTTLGLEGSAPALTDDGQTLVYLAPDQTLWFYPAGGAADTLAPYAYQEFVLAPGNVAYAVSAVTGGIDVIDLSTRAVTPYLAPPVEVTRTDPAWVATRAPVAHFGPEELITTVKVGSTLTLYGTGLDRVMGPVALDTRSAQHRLLNWNVVSANEATVVIPLDLAVDPVGLPADASKLTLSSATDPAFTVKLQISN
jgi:hypothetical protein